MVMSETFVQLRLFEEITQPDIEPEPPPIAKRKQRWGWKKDDKLNKRPGTKFLDDGFHAQVDPEPSQAMQDPWVALGRDVLLQGILEAQEGNREALHWLKSPPARLFCEALDLHNLDDVIKQCEQVPARVLEKQENAKLKGRAMRKYDAYARSR
jgi:hypothetical protein